MDASRVGRREEVGQEGCFEGGQYDIPQTSDLPVAAAELQHLLADQPIGFECCSRGVPVFVAGITPTSMSCGKDPTLLLPVP